MRALIRLSLRGRRIQVLALALTIAFSATLVGILGLLVETGVRGQVSTGEYGRAPVLIGAPQTRPVPDDVDLAVPGRALLPASITEEVSRALPGARVIADRIVPAVLVTGQQDSVPVEAHPWSAMALGDRDLAAGRAVESAGEVVLPATSEGAGRVELGDAVDVGSGGVAVPFTVVGLTTADDSGTDVADIYLSDEDELLQGTAAQRVSVVGVWPASDDDVQALERIATSNGARLWRPETRGEIEVVRQGSAKAELVSAAGAFGALGVIVSAFTLMVLTSLQLRERTRELAMLRVVGASPRRVRYLVCGEVRRVVIGAAAVGALASPFLGTALLGLLRSWDVVPRSLEPVYGPLPFVTAIAIAAISAEIAARVSLRRALRPGPLVGLAGADEDRSSSAKVIAGLAGLVLGLAMAFAPMYTTGEAAVGLPGLSGLVLALSIGPLSPTIVRLMASTQQRTATRSGPRYLALASLRARSARVGGALTPLVLGVCLSSTQLFTGSAIDAVTAGQVEAGSNADLLIAGPVAGIGPELTEEVAGIPDVAAVQPLVATTVLTLGRQDDANWHPLPALAVDGDQLEQYADLQPIGSDILGPTDGSVALSRQAAGLLAVQEGDELELVLADGRTIERRVGGLYLRGLGFGDVVLPMGDLTAATASGAPSALAITVSGNATVAEVGDRIEAHLAGRPGLEVSDPESVRPPGEVAGETAFPVLLLLILWGYIAITVVNSLVITTLARSAEFSRLRVVGATPAQVLTTARWEAAFLAATACLVATLAFIPGLSGLTFALSNGERILPGFDLTVYAVVVSSCFALVMATTEWATRTAMRSYA